MECPRLDVTLHAYNVHTKLPRVTVNSKRQFESLTCTTHRLKRRSAKLMCWEASPLLQHSLRLKSISSLVFRYETTTYLKLHSILRAYLCNSFLFQRAVFLSSHFTFSFLSSRQIDVATKTYIRYADESTTRERRT